MKETRRSLKEIVSISTCDHPNTPTSDACKEILIVFHYHPIAVVQMLAWGRMGYLPDGTMLCCENWEAIGDEVKALLRGTLITSIGRVFSGDLLPNEKGDFVLHSMEAMTTVLDGGRIKLRPPKPKLK